MPNKSGIVSARYKRKRVRDKLNNLNVVEGLTDYFDEPLEHEPVNSQNESDVLVQEDQDEFMSCLSDNDLVDPTRDFEDDYDSAASDDLSDNEEERLLVQNIIDLVDDDETEENELASTFGDSNRIKGLLAEWAVFYGICHNAVDALLGILRLFVWGMTLPKTARSLLKTPRSVAVRSVPPGEYHHFGLLHGIKEYLSREKLHYIPPVLYVFVGSDGLPLSKSSQCDCWPIVGMIKEAGEPYMFTIGIYVGPEKPSSFNNFYRQFVDEAKELEDSGFQWVGVLHKVKIKRFHFDAPARSSSLYIKPFNAYFGCGKCEQEGDWANKVVFPERDSRLRTNQSFREKKQEEHHVGVSILEELDIDMVDDVPIDPMHLVYLGVVRKMINLWLIDGPLCVRMLTRNFNAICNSLVSYAAWIPREFARKSRSLKFVKRYKATEFRQFLLYTGPVALKGKLSDRLYKNFLVLHVAIRILCHKEHCQKFNSYAKNLLHFFVQDFQNLYGIKYITYNVHNLLHLANEVLNCGPLETFSCFPFENYLHTIKRLIRKGNQHLQQIVKRLVELNKVTFLTRKRVRSLKTMSVRDQHHSGTVHTVTLGKQYQTLLYGRFHFSIKYSRDSCAYLDDGSVIVIENVVVKNGKVFVIGRSYIAKEDLYSHPIRSSKLYIYSAQKLSELQCWPAESIVNEGARFPLDTSNEDAFTYAIFPLYMEEH